MMAREFGTPRRFMDALARCGTSSEKEKMVQVYNDVLGILSHVVQRRSTNADNGGSTVVRRRAVLCCCCGAPPVLCALAWPTCWRVLCLLLRSCPAFRYVCCGCVCVCFLFVFCSLHMLSCYRCPFAASCRGSVIGCAGHWSEGNRAFLTTSQ